MLPWVTVRSPCDVWTAFAPMLLIVTVSSRTEPTDSTPLRLPHSVEYFKLRWSIASSPVDRLSKMDSSSEPSQQWFSSTEPLPASLVPEASVRSRSPDTL